jgi:hypothetical protein
MTAWGNIAGELDDVLYVRSGHIYFFNEGSYYRYNCKTKLVRRWAISLVTVPPPTPLQ